MTRYGPVLDALCPGCVGQERRLRCGVLYLRDKAAAAAPAASWEASLVLRAVESLGLVHGTATMPPAQLDELHHGMVRLMMVATALDARGPRGNV